MTRWNNFSGRVTSLVMRRIPWSLVCLFLRGEVEVKLGVVVDDLVDHDFENDDRAVPGASVTWWRIPRAA